MGSWSYKGSDGFFLVGRVVIRFWCPMPRAFYRIVSKKVYFGVLTVGRQNVTRQHCLTSKASALRLGLRVRLRRKGQLKQSPPATRPAAS